MTLSTAARNELIAGLSSRSQEFTTGMAHLQALIAARAGMNTTDLRAASLLSQEGPMTTGALQKKLHLTGGAATTAVDRLVQKDIAQRVADQADRRKVVVDIRDGALAGLQTIYAGIERDFRKLLEDYGDDELLTLVRLLDDLITLTERRANELSAQ